MRYDVLLAIWPDVRSAGASVVFPCDGNVHGKVDKLEGLKENVIIGKLIPAGTGAKKYRNADYKLEFDNLKEEPLESLEQELLD